MARPGQQHFSDNIFKYLYSKCLLYIKDSVFIDHFPTRGGSYVSIFPKILEFFFVIFTWLLQPDLQLGTQHSRPI